MMKNNIIMLSLFVFVGSLQYLQAQNRIVNNLCYDEELVESISVVSDIELSTLTILDKLKFRKKHYVKKHHEFINNTRNATHDIEFVSHINMFPKWYTHPSMIRNDETGVSSSFSKNNDYMDYMDYITEGWITNSPNTTQPGASMIVDDLKYSQHQPHSTKASEAYLKWNNNVGLQGFLYKYTFSHPNTGQLAQVENNGFSVTVSNNVIAVESSTIIFVWDTEEKVTIKQIIEEGTMVKTTKTYYKYNETFDTELIHEIVTTTPTVFDNGDCYELITRTLYTNYSNECSQDKTVFSKMEGSESMLPGEELRIYPNPSRNHIEILINRYEGKSTIQLYDINGGIILTRSVHPQNTKLRLDIHKLPVGMYYVKLLQGLDIYSSKFVKQ